MHSREIIKILEDDGWVLKRITGSHHHFVHADKRGLVTVAHPKPDIPVGTVKAIERQSGLQIWRTS